MGYKKTLDDAAILEDRPGFVRALRLKQQMRGVTQPDLIDTDGGPYIAKWKQNPVHRRVLVNSLVGAELLRRSDIAVPESAFIIVDAEFCVRNRSHRPLLQPGIHFGLHRPGNSLATTVYDLLPRSLSHKVTNRADFVRAIVFDCWVDNPKPRQAVFTGSADGFHGQMIGNGHILGFRSSAWSFDSRHVVHMPLPLAPSLYLDRPAAAWIENATVQIQKSARSDLEAIRRIIPEEWLESDGDQVTWVFEELLDRVRSLPDMIHASLAEFRQRAGQ